MQRRSVTTTLVFVLAFVGLLGLSFIASSAIAQNTEEAAWRADWRRLDELFKAQQQLTDEKECQAVWEILWPWAKKGNLEARAGLFGLSFPEGSHASTMYMPGAADEHSRDRHTIILGVYSIGVQLKDQFGIPEDEEQQEIFVETQDQVFNMLLRDDPHGRVFLECLNNEPREDCAEYAKKNFVPSFEDYAAEIDALLAQGMKPDCSFRNYPRYDHLEDIQLEEWQIEEWQKELQKQKENKK